MATINHPPHSIRPRDQWTINYSQGDVDSIREQIEQTESAKRHWLVLAFIIALAVLAASIALLSTNYALYSSSEKDKKNLVEENAALKARVDKTQQQLDGKTAQETKDAQARAEAESRLSKLMPVVLGEKAGGGEMASFARMVYYVPNSRVELSERPPNELFRNWKVTTGSTTEVFTMTGGFVDGKWVVYSNLIARK
jgi:cell division protein FtsB